MAGFKKMLLECNSATPRFSRRVVRKLGRYSKKRFIKKKSI